MDLALYDAGGGFFALGHGAGRAGRDFVTSPETGSLFGACVARDLDRRWRAFGSPDPFLVVEAGAGTGRLAREVQRAEPECSSALRYVLVERSAALRRRQRELLTLEPADEALGPFMRGSEEDELAPVPGAGPVFASVEDLPAMPVHTIVLANELLDNLPFGIARWDGDRWSEVRVALQGDAFVEVVVPATLADEQELQRLFAPGLVPPGARVPIPRGIDAWFAACGRALHEGALVLIDYIVDVEELMARGDGWLRTYRAHGRGDDPLREPGTQDITADIAREQLERAAQAAGFTLVDDRSQAEWLRELGIDALADEGRQRWDAGAARGDLDALAGRSRVHEHAALTDAGGLGAHRVVTFVAGTPRTGPRDRR
jgi:SAM-dependent MidA family methyltransferase